MTHQTVVVQSRNHLLELVNEAVNAHGPQVDLNHLDVSGLTSLSYVFTNNVFNGDISRWDVSNVVTMSGLFQSSAFNGDISNWDVSNVQAMDQMFYWCPFKGDLSKWDVSCVHTMESMFQGPNSQPKGLEHWSVGNVQTFFRMFKRNHHAYPLEQWAPRDDAYAMSFMDNDVLHRMQEPCFYHWYQAIAQMSPLKEVRQIPAEALRHLTPQQSAHLTALLPFVQTLDLHGMGCATMLQKQWVHRNNPAPTMGLPNMDFV